MIPPLAIRAFLLGLFGLLACSLPRSAAEDIPRTKDRELEDLLKSCRTVAISAKDNELEQLLKKRYNVAVERARILATGTLEGKVSAADLSAAIDQATKAGLEFLKDPKERMAVIERKVRFARMAEDLARARYQQGVGSIEDLKSAEFHHLTAKIELLKEKQGTTAAN
jgi:hypothetical protein